MNRAPLLLCCALPVLLAGFGGTSYVERADTVSVRIQGRPVSVQIEITMMGEPRTTLPSCKQGQVSMKARPCEGPGPTVPETRKTRSYSLTCSPIGGTLPLAARVCDYLARYPKAMLTPAPAPPGARRFICSGFMGTYSVFTVTAFVGGMTRQVRGEAFPCAGVHPDPTRDAIQVYAFAIREDHARLATLESSLRCGDPALLCGRDLTAAVQEAIRAAASLAPLRRIDAAAVFRHRTGSRPCAIPVGPRSTTSRRTLHGRCTVTVSGFEKTSSRPTVVFTEEWRVSPSATASHTWLVVLSGRAPTAKVVSVRETGAVPPQLWR